MTDKIETVEGAWDGKARNLAGLTKIVVNTAREQAIPVNDQGLASDVQGEEVMLFLSEVEKKLKGARIPGEPREVLNVAYGTWADVQFATARLDFDLNFLSRYLHLQGYKI